MIIFIVSMICVLFVREEIPSTNESLPKSSSDIKASSDWWFFILSKYLMIFPSIFRPIFYYGYYIILLLWMVFYPSLPSFLGVLWIMIDLAFTRTSNYCITRQTVMNSIHSEVREDNAGVTELILESLYERCILLPNQHWRFFTLIITLLVQLHSFIGVNNVSYGISDSHWIFILFGNHVGESYSHDKYYQFLLFVGMVCYFLV